MKHGAPLEIVIDARDAASARANAHAARIAGADRIEVCAGMHVEGLTAGVDAMRAAREAFGPSAGMMVMVRPRDGEFCYNMAELNLLRSQISEASRAGANGVVFGTLTPGHRAIDVDSTTMLVQHAHSLGLSVTFHRAIDAIALTSLPESVATLAGLGVERVLTSGVAWGQKGTAMDGLHRLQTMAALCGNAIELVLAGGMSESLAPRVLAALPVNGRYSVHAYTSVLGNGKTDPEKVKALKEAIGPETNVAW